MPTELGTDTAWTFEPRPPEYGRKALAEVGWDGKMPVLVVCPINPFWWPVKPSLAKYAAAQPDRRLQGQSLSAPCIFITPAPPSIARSTHYLTSIANAVDRVPQRRNVFVDSGGDRALDARACRRISEKLGGVPVFTSDQYNMYELVSILRACHMMASSRYHGIVTSMPALVPSAGITMDERIRNLMRERGHQDLLMNVDDPDLEPKLLAALETLATEGERIADGIARTVVKNLKVMARMGVFFEEEVQRRYPEFPTRKGRVELGRLSAADEVSALRQLVASV